MFSTGNLVQVFFDTTNTECAPNITLGLNDELRIEKINLYPNPASNRVTIVWDEIKVEEIKITSYNGRLIKNISVNAINGEKEIDLSGFSSGVYFVKVGSITKKLIVR